MKVNLHVLLLLCGMMFTIFLPKAQADMLVRDAEIETYLKGWGQPIFEKAGLDPDAVRIHLIQSNDVNAFVAGGPDIFLYTGLLLKAENSDEIIGVMAHETGHIVGGHLLRTRERMEHASAEALIAALLGVGAALATGNSDAFSAIATAGVSSSTSRFLSHSRVQESSADQAALTYLERAHMNPSGLVSFMQKLADQEMLPASSQSKYLQTHPSASSRVKTLEQSLEQSPYKTKKLPPLWQSQYERMKAKLVGYVTPEQVSWIYPDSRKDISAQYARAIAYYRQGNVQKALSGMDALLAIEPNNPWFHEQKGQILFENGRIREAMSAYQKAVDLMPEEPQLQIELARSMLDQPDQLAQAAMHLKKALGAEKRNPGLFRLLATVYGKIGAEGKARLYLAEEAVALADIKTARIHAEAARRLLSKETPEWLRLRDVLLYLNTKSP